MGVVGGLVTGKEVRAVDRKSERGGVSNASFGHTCCLLGTAQSDVFQFFPLPVFWFSPRLDQSQPGLGYFSGFFSSDKRYSLVCLPFQLILQLTFCGGCGNVHDSLIN